MFDSLLVANRGEIACRILRTARDLGLRTVAVYSDADAQAPHVTLADDSVPIGPAPAAESYLRQEAILEAARVTGVGAIHPGYGFLSENEAFAEAVEDAGLVFIGPPAKAIYLMGNKAEAKRLMLAANVPCVPGYQDEAQDDATLIAAAGDIGYPVMVKAAAGGGGRGMRLVRAAQDLPDALQRARSEAASAFGSDALIIEKAMVGARHVEIQVFADRHGNYIHLGERDCSLQRRHQKVIEESPCPALTPELRATMGASAVAAAKAVHYCGAGTVEFLLDGSGAHYFLEMNTRLQVEHPVTELVTGLDLVALQIAVAQGAALPLGQADVRLEGHAIEARLCAEDPANGYLPQTGRISLWRPAAGEHVRIDAGIAQGQEITPFYDSMLAKICAWGDSREVARQRLVRAVEDTVLLGPATNTTFLVELLQRNEFVAGEATTDFLELAFADGIAAVGASAGDAALAAALYLDVDRRAAFERSGYVSPTLLGWSSVALPPIPISLIAGDHTFDLTATGCGTLWRVRLGEDVWDVDIERSAADHILAVVDGRHIRVNAVFDGLGGLALAIGGKRLSFHRHGAGQEAQAGQSGGAVAAPMPGVIVDVAVQEGQSVDRGEALLVLEAMKMQHRIPAPISGTVDRVHVASGDRIGSGDLLLEITPAEDV